ncbi:MAG TPA: BON domain-containing protein [Steroidobacteraceae bacterium]|nr:BON domain-containing protein [Steroidobacteraceae bacterium]
MTHILTRALLVAAALGCTVMAGCTTDTERTTSTRQPAAARHPAPAPAGEPAAADQQTAGDAVDDAVVTAKVKARLVDDEVTKAYQINVETFQGTVQLSGSVDSEEARSRATELARNVGGVKDVKNSLQVRRSDG